MWFMWYLIAGFYVFLASANAAEGYWLLFVIDLIASIVFGLIGTHSLINSRRKS